jgi:predicted transcriptional regulator of viral defense system
MGKIKYIKNIRQFFKDNPVVDINSLKKFISKKDKNYVYLLISNMLKNKEINKITKGYYTRYNDPFLIVSCFKPAYMGLQAALSFHNIWEQEANPVILALSKIRYGIRSVFGKNVIIKRLSKKYFFGYDYFPYQLEDRTIYLPYSDIEKTFIDLVYFKQYIDPETLKEIKKRISKKKFNSYLKVYPKIIQKRILNVLKKNRKL